MDFNCIILLRLFSYVHATASWIVLFQHKAQKKHDPCGYGKDHKGIDVRERSRLCLHRLVNPGVGGGERFVSPESAVGKVATQSLRYIRKVWIIDPSLLHQS